MTEVEELEEKIEELENELSNTKNRLENSESEVGELEYQMNHHDCSEEGAQLAAEDIHQQIVYQGKDPIDVLDDLFREHGFIWNKAAA